jgi:hypothetical protein
MKLVIVLGVSLLSLQYTFAQSDSTLYLNGLPVSQDDTVRNFPSSDYYPKNKPVVISHDKLPERLRAALNREPIYKGWNRLPVLYDKNTDRYTVRVINENDTVFYGLDKKGNPLTYGKEWKDDQ